MPPRLTALTPVSLHSAFSQVRPLARLEAAPPPPPPHRPISVQLETQRWALKAEGGSQIPPVQLWPGKGAVSALLMCLKDITPKSLKNKGKPTHHGFAGRGPHQGQESDSAATSVGEQCTAALVLRTWLASNHCRFCKKRSQPSPRSWLSKDSALPAPRSAAGKTVVAYSQQSFTLLSQSHQILVRTL